MVHNEIVLDIETQNTFQEIGSRDARGLRISVIGVYATVTDAFSIYTEADFPRLW